MSNTDDMRSCIQEWYAECLDIEDLARTHAVIMVESEKQLKYMSDQLEQRLIKEGQ